MRCSEVTNRACGMIGCSAMIAVVAFVFGAIGSLFVSDATFTERLMFALMPAAMTFIAAFFLGYRDQALHRTAMQTVRKRLMTRADLNEIDYLAHFPNSDSTLLAQTRRAVSQFFDVPPEKIHPSDRLREDLQFDRLQPSFHTFVVYHVLEARKVTPQPFAFHTRDLADLGDLANEIQRILDGFDQAKTDHNQNLAF